MSSRIACGVFVILVVAGITRAEPPASGDTSDIPYYTPKIQLHPDHIRAVLAVLAQIPNPRLLVWGVGYDSRMWCAAGGRRTLFIEDDPDWRNLIAPRIPCRVVMVSYETRRTDAPRLLGRDASLRLALPDKIHRSTFDVIVVDAPAGHSDESPGRMKSIYMSSVLAHDGSWVFIDDYGRPVERSYSERYLTPRFGPPDLLPGRDVFARFHRATPDAPAGD